MFCGAQIGRRSYSFVVVELLFSVMSLSRWVASLLCAIGYACEVTLLFSAEYLDFAASKSKGSPCKMLGRKLPARKEIIGWACARSNFLCPLKLR